MKGKTTLVYLLKKLLNHDLKEELFKRMEERGEPVSQEEWGEANKPIIYAEVVTLEQYEFGAILGAQIIEFVNPVLIEKEDALFSRIRKAMIPLSEGPFIAEVRCSQNWSGGHRGECMYVETNSAGLLRGYYIDLQDVEKIEIINATGVDDYPLIRFIMKPKIRQWR